MGRVLEQGLMEVMEEEELAAMKEHQQQLQAIRDAGARRAGTAGAAAVYAHVHVQMLLRRTQRTTALMLVMLA